MNITHIYDKNTNTWRAFEREDQIYLSEWLPLEQYREWLIDYYTKNLEINASFYYSKEEADALDALHNKCKQCPNDYNHFECLGICEELKKVVMMRQNHYS